MQKGGDMREEIRKFVIPDNCWKYAARQLIQIESNPFAFDEISKKEFDAFSPFIPLLSTNILDLGCGLGRMSAYYNWHRPGSHFILADSTEFTGTLIDEWEPGVEWYNDLSLTKQFVEANGLTDYQLFDVRSDCWESLPKCDLVMSVRSIGFHWKIEGYLDRLLELASDDATFVFGVRSGKYDENSFSSVFKNRVMVPGYSDRDNLLILK
ncbi:MAG: hypothetical protein ACUZ8H_07350 [Candidatus Anammoxibacter sp.]